MPVREPLTSCDQRPQRSRPDALLKPAAVQVQKLVDEAMLAELRLHVHVLPLPLQRRRTWFHRGGRLLLLSVPAGRVKMNTQWRDIRSTVAMFGLALRHRTDQRLNAIRHCRTTHQPHVNLHRL